MVFRMLHALIACVLLATATSAQSTKLNGELTQPVGGNVTVNYQVTPDGSRVVYQADQDVDEDFEIYSVPTDGSVPAIRLSGFEGDVDYHPSFELSPDGTRVAYYADISVYFVPTDGSTSRIQLDTPPPGASMGDTDPFFRLADNDWLVFWNEGEGGIWSAPTDGGTGIPLSSTATYVAGDFLISPDATRVFFRSNINFTGLELFSRRVDGSGAPISFGNVDNFRLTADGTRVVYRDDRDTPGDFELYSAPSDGTGAPVKLNGTLAPGGDVSFLFELSPDGSRAVYIATQDTTGVNELYSVPVDGSAPPRKISGQLTSVGDVTAFRISPDSKRVVYRADREIDDVFELYSVPIHRSTGRFKLNGPLVAGGDVSHLFQISPDSRRVVYFADQDTDGVTELYSASIDQGSRRRLRRTDPIPVSKLNGPLVAGGSVATTLDLGISADGSQVIYRADQTVDEQYELFSAAIDGSTPAIQLNDPFPPGCDVHGYKLGTDRVVYLRPLDLGAPLAGVGVFSTRIDGDGSPVELNSPMPLGPVAGDVHGFQISPDGTRSVYHADQDSDSVDELYSVPTRGGATPIKLNGALVPGGDVGFGYPTTTGAFEISPDGADVVYMADQDVDNQRDLYRVPINGSETPFRLTSGGLIVTEFRISPDGQWVVYRDTPYGDSELFSVRLDGTQPPVELSGPMATGGDVLSFAISPDSARVVYRSDEDVDGRFELFSVPVNGSASPVRLHSSLSGSRDVTDYAIAPDSQQVVYLVDQAQNDVFDCYSVPIDRSGPPIRLSDVTNGSRAVLAFEIADDSQHVVFVGDCDLDEVFEIYSVPIDRVSPPTKLNPALVSEGDVGGFVGREFAISADASRVVYIADQETDGTRELFSVPIGGLPSATKLNGPMVAGGQLNSFEIAANSKRVVFFANQPVVGPRVIYSVPITGSRPAIQISGTPLPGRYIRSYALDPFGNQLLYVAEQDTDLVRELYRVPIRGNHEPVKLNGPVNGPHNEIHFQISPRANRVVYRGDQEADEVFELFSSRLGKLPLGSEAPTVLVVR